MREIKNQIKGVNRNLGAGKWLTRITLSMQIVTYALVVLIAPHFAQAKPGDLDLSFSNDGKVTRPLGSAEAIAIQSDRKIVVSGGRALVRYNPNGTVDTSFGDNGRVIADFGGNFNEIYDMAIQSDGKIVVVGRHDKLDYNVDFLIARFNPDGSLDNTFGTNGKVITNFKSGSDELASGVAIQQDGKIVAAGTSITTNNFDFAIARYNSNGSLDNTFGTNGKVTTDFNNGSREDGADVAIQSDGKILVAGSINADDFALARYNPNGSLDTTFSSDGKVTTDIGGSTDQGRSIAIQSNGKIVVVGETNPEGLLNFALARYNLDGTLDSAFGSGGIVTTDFDRDSNDSSFSNDSARDVVIQEDGKIVAVGFTHIAIFDENSATSLDWDFALARYNSNGFLDRTFGVGGKVITDFGDNTDDQAFAAVIQKNDGRIVAAGSSYPYCLTQYCDDIVFALARYHAIGCQGFDVTQIGTKNNDSIVGRNIKDVIHGLGGSDTISGLRGNDIICGGTGNDLIKGGKGNDTLKGEKGNDTLRGGLGNDKLNGGVGTDTCNGGDGTDTAKSCETIRNVP